MLLSKYVFVFPYEGSAKILFNSLTGSLIKMDSACFCYGQPLKSKLSSQDISVLQEGGYLTDDGRIIPRLESAYLCPDDKLMLSVELTRRCNLACSYCYQNGWPERGTIGLDTIDKIASYVQKCAEFSNYQTVKVDFIGGEPFLAGDKMARLYDKLKNICTSRNINLEAQAETNGTLLEPRLIKMFNQLDLSVTLSPPEDHNKLRSFKNGRGSYEIIISNLMKCREIFKRQAVKLSLRYNVHAGNHRLFPSFLEEIKSLALPVKIIKTAYAEEYQANTFQNGLSLEEFIDWNSSEAIDALIRYEYPIPFFPHASTKRCEAYQPYNCKVFFDGSVGLCNASQYGTSNLHIDQIAANPETLNEYYKTIKAWTPLQDSECRGCNHLLLCGGKTFCRKIPCSYTIYNLELFLKKFVQYSERGLGHLFVT